MKPELKKLLILNAPYLLFVYLFDKIGQAVRLAPGADLSGKVLSLADGFSAAFATPLPSLAPMDLLIGIVGAVLIRLMVYFKGKNAKKYRKGIEYGSARWGNAEDIKPYTDPVFQNNVLLTQTERLTMNSRPKQPKYARNKNILVIGGSGSGKTRFFVKPNLMQMHSSYVVTDPKGTVLVECGKLLQRGGYRIKVLNTINLCKSTHNRRERPVYGHRGWSRGRFYYRITTFEGRPWDARDPHKTTFMALKHAIRLSIWRKQKETPGVEKAPGVSSPQRKESGRSGRDDGSCGSGCDPAIHTRRLRVYHRPRRLRMALRISIILYSRRFSPANLMG